MTTPTDPQGESLTPPDCSIADLIIKDFDALWMRKLCGNALEIVTPYLMPNSKFFMLYVTKREERYIACEGGSIRTALHDFGEFTESELSALRELAKAHGIKEGDNKGEPIFFKECTDPKLISSIAFDVSNFSTMAAHVLGAMADYETELAAVTKERDELRERDAASHVLLATHKPELEACAEYMKTVCVERDRLQAENRRLRSALDEIANDVWKGHDWDFGMGAVKIAQETIKPAALAQEGAQG